MANPTLLLLRLEGPLQSWGTRARWDVRDSAPEPTKSGIIGLLGCALGYRMYDSRLERELDESLQMGVRVETPGEPLLDYQTISGVLPRADGGVKGTPDAPATIESPRTYLQDAAFLVVLEGAVELLKRCRDALVEPRWPVFLGRKSCPPVRPVLEGLTDHYSSIDDALQRHPWSCQSMEARDSAPAGRLSCTVEDIDGPSRRQDATRVNPARMFGFRAVRTFNVKRPPVQERNHVPDETDA